MQDYKLKRYCQNERSQSVLSNVNERQQLLKLGVTRVRSRGPG